MVESGLKSLKVGRYLNFNVDQLRHCPVVCDIQGNLVVDLGHVMHATGAAQFERVHVHDCYPVMPRC